MVSRAFGAARQSYTLTIGAAQDSSLPRVFGRVDRQVQATRDRVDDLREAQQRLQTQLRETRKGTDEYERLQAEIRRTKDESDRLTAELGRQEHSWRQLGQRTNRWRNLTLGAIGAVSGAIAGATIALDRQGDSFARVNFVAQRLNLPVEQIQRMQIAARGLGGDLDAIDLLEFDVRLGELRDGLIRNEPALQGTRNAFEAMGFDIRTVSARDIPALIERLRALPPALAQFYSDEIFSGTAAEQFIAPLLTAQDEYLERVQRTSVLSQEQGDRILEARSAMNALRQETVILTGHLATGLGPAIKTTVETLTPTIQAFSEFASQNPVLVQAALGLATAFGTLTAALWALNAARAAALALSGPVGIGILVGAGALLAAGGITVASLAARNNRQRQVEELFREEEAQATAKAVAISAQSGTFEGTLRAGELAAARNADALQNILPECPDAAFQNAIAQTATRAAEESFAGGAVASTIDIADESALTDRDLNPDRYRYVAPLTNPERYAAEQRIGEIEQNQATLAAAIDNQPTLTTPGRIFRPGANQVIARQQARLDDLEAQLAGLPAPGEGNVLAERERILLGRQIADARETIARFTEGAGALRAAGQGLEAEKNAARDRIAEADRTADILAGRPIGPQLVEGIPAVTDHLAATPPARAPAPAETTNNIAGDDNRRSAQTTTINIEQTNNIQTTEAASEVEAGVQQAVSDYAVGR